MPLTDAELRIAFTFPAGLGLGEQDEDRSADMAGLSPFGAGAIDDERGLALERLNRGLFSPEEDRAVGALLGLAVGDALGAPLEFTPLAYGARTLTGFDADAWQRPGCNRFGLQPGQWTDDTSLALCLADSLLLTADFVPRDLRLRFLHWWNFGYGNAFGFDRSRADRRSVGLGGSIAASLAEFIETGSEDTTAGDPCSAGNGSLMRNAPAAILHHDDCARAEALAARQSRTTHRGTEAAEACRLLAHCIVHAIHGDGRTAFLARLASTFRTDCHALACLAAGEREARHPDNRGQRLADRDWRWRSDEHRYSPTRALEEPDYVGSYALDALAMALHCVWSTRGYAEAVLKAANLGGDADSVAAVTGQLAGSIHGASAIPRPWLDAVLRWDPRGDMVLRACRLYRGQRLAYRPLRASAC